MAGMAEVREIRQQVADQVAAVVAIPARREPLVRRDKDLPEDHRAQMLGHTAAQAAAARAQLVQTAMQAQEQAALEVLISAAITVVAAVVVLQVLVLQQAAQVAAVRVEDQPQQPEQQVQQIQAAVVAELEFQQVQEPLRAALVEAALSLCAIPARQSAPLLVQQIQQHNPAVTHSIPS